ncbi:AarF/ABC1/UbiB kinase family protein [Rhodoferax sp.]|uniref:ABC1 kinase family protein n=1 Tax=Rhodoferax sp. TaxID=50421 RepID=UPI00284826B4|nr:AarF/ABC1/UbiB kinase family protein [Rhodoferax sp.]MDR3367571.1 AarF/ABC1/UbiB kinase family protein [Rhodoferax sp.]
MAQAPRTGKLARSAIVGVAVARAGVAQLTHATRQRVRAQASTPSTQEAHDETLGRIAFTALNQLKGVALKASQLLSLDVGLVPEGIRQQLARAHYQATPLNRALVLKLLRQEFGQGPDDLFAQFEPQAFAAASLGQVHTATLHTGEAVAVKLQYPGMAATLQSDLQLLRLLLTTLSQTSAAMPSPQVLEQTLTDIATTLAQELDYQQEAAQLQWFAQHLPSPWLVIPQPVPSHSTAHVLTMHKLNGLHLQDWLATHPNQAERDHYGQLLFDLFLHSCFCLQRLQTDPHPGNFLFMPGGQLGLLDFGCTRALDPAFCSDLARAWRAVLRSPKDTPALQAAYTQLGLIDPAMSTAVFRSELMPALQAMQDWQVLPFRSAVYDFGQLPLPPRPDAQHQQLMQHLRAMPPDLPYFDRAHLGLLQLLRAMGARVHTGNAWIF